MALQDIVDVTISATTSTPTRPGFGTPLIAAYHTKYADRVRVYNLPNDLLSDGFATTDDVYLAATAVKAQNPSVKKFKVGRLALPVSDVLTMQILDATVGDVVAFTLEGHAFSYTIAKPSLTAASGDTITFAASDHSIARSSGSWLSDGFAVGQTIMVSGTSSNNALSGTITGVTSSKITFASGVTDEGPLSSTAVVSVTAQTDSGVANAVEALINAASIATLASVTASTDTLTISAASAGHTLRLAGWDTAKVAIENTSTDAGIATDLAAIAAADNDWYGLGLTQQGKATVVAAAAYANTNKKLFGYDTPSSSVLGSGSSDVASTLKAAAYEHTFGMYNGQDTKAYPALALMGSRLSQTPGSDTWAFKILKGILPDTLTPTQYSHAMAKNINIYTTVGNANITQFGKSADGEFTDTIRFIDWLTAQVQVNVFAALAAMPKIPFTDAGISVVVGMIMAALSDGVKAGGLVLGSIAVQAPAAADVDTIDKQNRNLPDVTFSGTLAGAIHSVTITGTVQV